MWVTSGCSASSGLLVFQNGETRTQSHSPLWQSDFFSPAPNCTQPTHLRTATYWVLEILCCCGGTQCPSGLSNHSCTWEFSEVHWTFSWKLSLLTLPCVWGSLWRYPSLMHFQRYQYHHFQQVWLLIPVIGVVLHIPLGVAKAAPHCCHFRGTELGELMYHQNPTWTTKPIQELTLEG